MIWIAPSEKDADNAALDKRLRAAADQFRANSGLKSQEYSAPVLGLIFLRFAEVRFATHRAKLCLALLNWRRRNRAHDLPAYRAVGTGSTQVLLPLSPQEWMTTRCASRSARR